jgi:hypothetical protein
LLISLFARDTRQTDPTATQTNIEDDRARQAMAGAEARRKLLGAQLADPRFKERAELLQQRDGLRQKAEQARRQSADTATEQTPEAAQKRAIEAVRHLTVTNDALRKYIGDAFRDAQAAEQKIRDLQRQRENQVERLRFPQERDSGRQSWFIALRNGRAYPLFYFQPASIDSRVRNTGMIAWTDLPNDEVGVQFKAGAGIDLATSPQDLLNALRPLPRQSYFVYLVVFEDSFAAATVAKKAALELGFEYGMQLMKLDADLKLVRHGQRPSAL